MNNPHYKLIFENSHVIIVDKSASVLSVPSRQGSSDLRPVLGIILEKDLSMRLFPVHRLDFEVSGLIIFAKTPFAQSIASKWFEEKSIIKTYYAKTRTNIENKFALNLQMIWECRLLKGKKRAYEGEHGKHSITEAILVKKDREFSFYSLNPRTGRSHQLRYELYRHHEPIIGDKLYGSHDEFTNGGIALQAYKLNFLSCTGKDNLLLPDEIEIDKFF